MRDASGDRPPVAIHVSPHPDDEALGAPATLTVLRNTGWRVLDVVVSRGRPSDHHVRTREAQTAHQQAALELLLVDPPLALSADDDLAEAEARVTEVLSGICRLRRPLLLISPSPDDAHHGHKVVARAVGRAIESVGAPCTWWTWSLWSDLSSPTIYVPFDSSTLEQIVATLSVYESQTSRNDYFRLLRARAELNAIRGSEQVFGFGSSNVSDLPYAELLTELIYTGDWQMGAPRILDSTGILATLPDDRLDRHEIVDPTREVGPDDDVIHPY